MERKLEVEVEVEDADSKNEEILGIYWLPWQWQTWQLSAISGLATRDHLNASASSSICRAFLYKASSRAELRTTT